MVRSSQKVRSSVLGTLDKIRYDVAWRSPRGAREIKEVFVDIGPRPKTKLGQSTK